MKYDALSVQPREILLERTMRSWSIVEYDRAMADKCRTLATLFVAVYGVSYGFVCAVVKRQCRRRPRLVDELELRLWNDIDLDPMRPMPRHRIGPRFAGQSAFGWNLPALGVVAGV